jgi:hypothetical protein
MTHPNLAHGITAFVTGLALCACSVSQNYDVTGGPGATPQNTGALVIPNKRTEPAHPFIRSIDGKAVDWLDQEPFDSPKLTVRLAPGEHHMLFGFTQAVNSTDDFHSEKDKAFTFVAAAGKMYRIVIWYSEEPDPDGDIRSKDAKDLLEHTAGPSRSWRAKLVEVETGREIATDTP